MKHTTTRKKMLLSSVAMLLVAMMALGSATFAWFTQNTTVTANGLSAKAAASSGIKILSETKAASLATASEAGDDTADTFISDINSYDYSTTLDTADSYSTMTPASLDLTQTNAIPATAYSAKAAATNASAKNTDNYTDDGAVYTEKVYVALDDENTAATSTVKVNSVTINSSSAYPMAQGVRVAVYYTDNAGTSKLVNAYSNDANKGKVVTGATTTGEYTFKASNVSANAGTVSATAGQCYFTVKVYLDGEHANVFTDNIIKTKDLITSINMSFGLAAE